MKTITIHELRYHFPRVERLLRENGPLLVIKRGKVIAKLQSEVSSASSETKTADRRPQLPDFLGRLKEIYGDQVFETSGAELIFRRS